MKGSLTERAWQGNITGDIMLKDAINTSSMVCGCILDDRDLTEAVDAGLHLSSYSKDIANGLDVIFK